jgi:hypothetical protein
MKEKISKQDKVLEVIGRSENGINRKGIIKETGFNYKSVHAILYKLKKRGKINNISHGVFVKL